MEFNHRSARLRTLAGVGATAIAALAVAAGSSSAHVRSHSSTAGTVNKQVAEYGTVVAGNLPPVGTPKSGGTLTIGQLAGQTPLAVFPITNSSDSSTPSQTLVTNMYVPLFYGPDGAKPQVDYSLSLASGPPVESNGGKTYTIHLKSGVKWSDGQPVDANGVVFMYDLLKAAIKASPSNWGQYSPGLIPDNVKSLTAPNATTVVIQFTKPYNPGFVLYNQLQDTNWGLYSFPENDWNIDATGGPHITDWATNPTDALNIYKYLEAQGTSLSTFASNPLWQVVDGPFKLTSFNTTNSSYTLAPNTSYSLPIKPKVSQIDVNTYTSLTAQLDAEKTGAVDIAGLDAGTQLGQIPSLESEGSHVFGTPGFGWYGGIINFEDTTNHWNKIIVQPYVKKALAELIDQPAIIQGVYHGWAVPASGPIPSAPDSPYAPVGSGKPVYPYNGKAAAALLKANGWHVVPGGQTTCAKGGAGAGHCGAGIPTGTKFAFVWANVPEQIASTGVLESEAFASSAEQYAGVKVTLVSKSFNTLVTDYNDQNPAAKKYTNDWAVNNFGGIQFDYYPTQYGLLTPGAGFNLGNYSDKTGDSLMLKSVFSTNPDAVKTEDKYLAANYPVFFMPDEDQIYVVNKNVGGQPGAFLELGTQVWAGNEYYFKK